MPETYRGFCSNTNGGDINTNTSGIDVIKCDLLNHFHTRLGERIGRPDFGSIIHDLLFDLEDPRTESLIVQDANRIINDDPRVEMLELNLDVSPDSHSVTFDITLRTIGIDQANEFFDGVLNLGVRIGAS